MNTYVLRYIQVVMVQVQGDKLCPSEARAKLLIVDISNLLLCITQLLPSICDKAEDLLGLTLNNKNKILRDIHSKCQELLNCLLLRGTPLDYLHKIFRKGIENVALFKSKTSGPSPWIIFAMHFIFNNVTKKITKMLDLPDNIAIVLELFVLLGQPQPNWALLVKILTMRNCKILRLILSLSLEKYNIEMQKPSDKSITCNLFLCTSDGSCEDIDTTTTILNQSHYYNLIMSTTYILINLNNIDDFNDILLTLITKHTNWAKCFDRRNVWNQIRPPWYEAIINLIKPYLPIITKTVINAYQTGASMYQVMLIVLACFSQLWDCIEIILAKLSNLLQDILPADVIPLNNSVLIQILISALYSELLILSKNEQKTVRFSPNESKIEINGNQSKESRNSVDSCLSSEESIVLAIAESLCSIDEDNKHTDQIEEFLEQVKDDVERFNDTSSNTTQLEYTESIVELLTSDILMNKHGKRSLKILYRFIEANYNWLLEKLEINKPDESIIPDKVIATPLPLLHVMFHIANQRFDQLLTNEWQPNWHTLLQTPMGLSVDRVWSQIALRWEFRDINSPSLSTRDAQIVANLMNILKQN